MYVLYSYVFADTTLPCLEATINIGNDETTPHACGHILPHRRVSSQSTIRPSVVLQKESSHALALTWHAVSALTGSYYSPVQVHKHVCISDGTSAGASLGSGTCGGVHGSRVPGSIARGAGCSFRDSSVAGSCTQWSAHVGTLVYEYPRGKRESCLLCESSLPHSRDEP